MFLASANLHKSVILRDSLEGLVDKILGLYGGVPLMLSIAGAQVWRRSRTPRTSLKRLLSSLEGSLLLEKQPEHYPFRFNQAVEASLDTIADALETSKDYKKHWDEYCGGDVMRLATTTIDFLVDRFRRLCILPRGERVSQDLIFGI